MHFVYDTKHLNNAPWEADWQSRLDSRAQTAAVMQKAYRMAWDHVHQWMEHILAPLGKPDEKLRTATQWRRAPFGINRLEKNCDFLGLSRGQIVPQIVIHENVRERKPKGSTEWLIDPHLSATITSRSRSKGGAEDEATAFAASGRALEIIRDACEAEWDAPFPRAEKAGIEGGEVIIRFANHAGDKNPSTFVKGQFRRLEVCGNNDFDRDFYLPGNLTASELASWAREIADAEESRPDDDSELTPEQRAEIIERERKTIRGTTELYLTPEGRDRLITTIEGAGKTQGLLDSMSSEMLDRAMDAPDGAPQHFMCYAARSKQQAIEKRREYDKRRSPFDCKTVALESFWSVYAEKCAEAATKPLEQYEFESRTANDVMRTIEVQQPEVYRLLEEYRRNFWNDAQFDCGTTMIFTTKATIRTWYTSRLTRTIFHPRFELGMSPEQEKRLADDFGLGIVAFDELELDEFLHIWTEPNYTLIESQQKAHPDWTSLAFTQRLGVYANIRFDSSFPRPSFEQFDADMRVRLSSLEKVLVNFHAIPYGRDNSDSGIYRGQNGKPFYLGVQQWLAWMTGRRNFLTTERLMTEVVRAAYRKQVMSGHDKRKARLVCARIDPPSELFPISVPVCIDKRASGRRAADLAREITEANSNAYVICNGVKDNDRVLTFQKAKGANHLADRDIYIIVTHLNPDHYAELNVVGQWLGIPDVIELHYRDQISQAVGRNRGFRDTGNGRKTVVIASAKLAQSGLFRSAALPASQPSREELEAGWSEFRKKTHEQIAWMVMDNEFAPPRAGHDHLRFALTTERLW
jgi:hypothetical protein